MATWVVHIAFLKPMRRQAGYFSDSRYGGRAVLPGPPVTPAGYQGCSLGLSAWKPWEGYPRNRAPLVGRRGDELSPAGVWRRKPLHLCVSERTRRVVPPQWCYGIAPVHHGGSWRTPASCPPRSHCALGLAPRTTRVKLSRRVVSWCPSLRWRGEPGPSWLAGSLQSKPRRQ